MATANVAPTGAKADAKATVVQIRNAVSAKLDYLRVLANKLIASSKKGVAQTITFMRRSWGIIPLSFGGALVSGLTATKSGYRAVTGFISSVIRSAYCLLGKARRWSTDISDYGIQLLAKVVGKINKPAGAKISSFGFKMTDYRERFWAKANYYVSTLALVIKAAVEHTITATIVPIWSSLIGVGFLLNQFTGGMASTLATGIPVVGKYAVAAMAGGPATALAIIGVAFLGGVVSIALKSKDIIAQAQAQTIVSAMNFIETDESDISSVIVEMSHGDVKVKVEGDVTIDQATDIAMKHIAEEVTALEKVVRPNITPKQNNYPSNQNKNKKKK